MSVDAFRLLDALLVLDESTLGTQELAERMTQFTLVQECATPELTVMQREEYLYVPVRLSGRLEISGYLYNESNPAIRQAIEGDLTPTFAWMQTDGMFWTAADFKMGTLTPLEGDGIWRFDGSAQRSGPYNYGDLLDAAASLSLDEGALGFMYVKSLAAGASVAATYSVGGTDYSLDASAAGLYIGALETSANVSVPSGTSGQFDLEVTPSSADHDVIWGWGIEKELT